jgi:hypothetical protein
MTVVLAVLSTGFAATGRRAALDRFGQESSEAIRPMRMCFLNNRWAEPWKERPPDAPGDIDIEKDDLRKQNQ